MVSWSGAFWVLHFSVMGLAAFTEVTGTSAVWVGVRWLGEWGGFTAILIWMMSAILAPAFSGPSLWGWLPGKRPRWLRGGHPGWYTTALLVPTVVLMGVLLGNTWWYFSLYRAGRADGMVPLPLVMFVWLGVWVWATLYWQRGLRRAGVVRMDRPTSRKVQLGLGALVAFIWAFELGFMSLHAYERPPEQGVDLAVVLGGRLNDDGTASIDLKNRVQLAIDLYKQGLVRHILLSGGMQKPITGVRERNEVAAMWKVCRDQGVPEDAISLDPVGVNTRATAFNTREFMRDHGYASVVACSTDFHLYRTHMSFAEVGIQANTLAARPTDWRCADPRDTLREMVGVVVYTVDPRYREAKGSVMQLTAPRLVVKKTAGTVELFDGDRPVKTYACITGGLPGDKEVEGDRRTPVGVFRIVYKNPMSKFHLSMGLDYPNKEDAERGLKAGLITQTEYEGILAALQSDLTLEANQKKLWYTKLGGEIFIHGYAEGRTGTAGCVALQNPDVDELYAILPIGTKVDIRP